MSQNTLAVGTNQGKKILLLTPRGFCAGVVRAIDVVKIALDLYGAPIYVRKEIVHNKHVVDQLRAAGAVFIDELSEVPEGARLIFSAHGVSPEVRREAQKPQAGGDRRDLPLGYQSPSGSCQICQAELHHHSDRTSAP